MGVCCSNNAPQHNRGRYPTIGEFVATSHLRGVIRENIREHYKFIKILGHGHFGTVREAIRLHQSTRQQKYAIKSIPISKIHSIDVLKNELEILQQADHPNIIKLFQCYEDSNYVHLVMELCTGGDLLEDFLRKGVLDEETAAKWLEKICSAVTYLHNLHICHRDIKPENFLLTTRLPDAELKMIDFGLSTKFSEDQKELHSVVGTPYYLAPEVINKNYGVECDVWSIGIMMYLLLGGYVPFTGDNHHEVFDKILHEELVFRHERWELISNDAKDLLSQMLTKSTTNRIKLPQVLKHSWFKRYRKNKLKSVPLNVIETLMKYHAPDKLRKYLMKLIIKNMSYNEIKELDEIFRALDTNKTGVVNAFDVVQALKNAKQPKAVEKLEKLLERNKYLENGDFYYSDFIIATLDKKKVLNEDILKDVFYSLTNGTQATITPQDLYDNFLRSGIEVTQGEVDDMINQFKAANKEFDYEAFQEIVMQNSPLLDSPMLPRRSLKKDSSDPRLNQYLPIQ
ncbi:unnamed protein product [Blepharisma stoltei]|uniref:non-specific serine/threonine protein kinase n=1 Tax=Blepharisma stoltei TaxID=1481888 RepID=A0AAU9IRF7_9CILI|nr:unnamed protein product [Blepharisma stoltei]